MYMLIAIDHDHMIHTSAPPTLSAEQQRALDQLRGGARIDGDSTREFPTLVYRCLLGNVTRRE